AWRTQRRRTRQTRVRTGGQPPAGRPPHPAGGARGTALVPTAALAGMPVPAHTAGDDPAGRGARSFVVERAPYLLGQAVDWLDDGEVVWEDPPTPAQDNAAPDQVTRDRP